MRTFATLMRRELAGYFFSVRGYVIIAGVQFLLGASLLVGLDFYNEKATDLPVTEMLPNSEFFWLVLLLMAPMITMRTFAHEKATGTYETLLTTPVGDWSVVLAKFLGALVFFLITWAPALAWPLVLNRHVAEVAPVGQGALAGCVLGIALLGAFFMAMGCFASAITRSQIIAAMTSFAIGAGVLLLGLLPQYRPLSPGWQTDLLQHVSLLEHMGDFASGIVDTRHVVFYVSLTLVFLFLTERVVASRRWR